MIDDDIRERAEALLTAAREAGVMVVTCESCTGGLISGSLTAIAGSSDVVEGGFVTYSNSAKIRLGVPESLIEAHGAVSEEVARAMAEAARDRSGAAPNLVSVSVTGVAGPGGGSAEKPVGLVHFAAAAAGATVHRECRFGDIGRDSVRKTSVLEALNLLDGLIAPE
ncbi:damage-inducible protein CinA [Acuticoccus sediminis]|uniref:Damage-inducible protein CinA n=1 Tax=Acuticoccus sediminis TaxID=2184697 RepID=A0A8B2NKI7_9HYPH|nr:CinA family protein [Acuticoccus sediminis]RAI00125.1 damage-inducible protein CinA [Acuticoccus sediminis]